MITEHFARSANRFVAWMRDEALPLWTSRGIHADIGAAVERLLPDGSVDEGADLRLLVQARQIVVFAQAAEQGWLAKDQAKALIDAIVRFARRYGRAKNREGYVFSLTPALTVADGRLDLYHHAFFLLASACRHRVFGDQQAIDEAHELMDLIDNSLAATKGWQEGDYPVEMRRQNPHMHLLEAFLALARTTGEARWRELADQVVGLFDRHFFDTDSGVLTEYFDDSLNPAAGVNGQIVEPGHLLEWVWLLYDYQSLSGINKQATIDALYVNGIGPGLTASGLLVDEILTNGDVHNADVRLWPMTEFIKACVLKSRDGDAGALSLAAKAINALMETFLRVPIDGAYIDRRAANGEVTVGRAPATALYHLMGAAVEVNRYLSDAASGRK